MNKWPKIELHCHTTMSRMKGLIRPDELIRHANDSGYKAIAITDYATVQAFPEAYLTWKKLWEKYKLKCQKRGETVKQDNFLKVIYGIECTVLTEEGKHFPILIYARNNAGIRDLYKLITDSALPCNEELTILKTSLDKKRNNLLIGAVCDGGEVCVKACSSMGMDDEKVRRVISWYDFIELVPLDSREDDNLRLFSKDLLIQMIKLGKECGKPVVAASDAYYIREEDSICRDILNYETGNRKSGRPEHLMDCCDLKSEFDRIMNLEVSDGWSEIETEIFRNQAIIADQIEYISPLCEGRFLTDYPKADEKLTTICNERLRELFGVKIPDEARERLDCELKAVCNNGYAGIYMMWKDLVGKSNTLGYPVTVRGGGAASLIAYLCGVSDVNPLSEKLGGFDLPIETFLGENLEKEPDFDLNVATHVQEQIVDCVANLPGVGEICRVGTIHRLGNRRADKYVEWFFTENRLSVSDLGKVGQYADRIYGVKRNDSAYPDALLIIPEGKSVTEITPLLYADQGDVSVTQFDSYIVEKNLLKMDIIGNPFLDLLGDLQKMTGLPYVDIPSEDESVMNMLCDGSVEEIPGLPEFGSYYARSVIRETKPGNIHDLIKISALTHGTGIWQDNQRELVIEKDISLQDCIASRDDVFLFLVKKGMDISNAYRIMESVRKGRGLDVEDARKMNVIGVPDWYIDVCRKIKYLFPKAHCASYTLVAWRVAYYMTYYPEAFREAYKK